MKNKPLLCQPRWTGRRSKNITSHVSQDKMDQVVASYNPVGRKIIDDCSWFQRELPGLTADDSVLVLADIVGGSPLTTAATPGSRRCWKARWSRSQVNYTKASTAVVTAMLMEHFDLSATILSEARSALQPLQPLKEEDDDRALGR